MNSRVLPIAAGATLALLCGLASLGTTAYAAGWGVDHLPDGVKRLGADSGECQGQLTVEAGVADERHDTHTMGLGETNILEVNDPNLHWSCANNSDTMECPQGTHFIRIGHDSGVARFECYSRGGAYGGGSSNGNFLARGEVGGDWGVDRLPKDARRLDAGTGECHGVLTVEAGVAHKHTDTRSLPEGGSNILEVNDPNLSWRCDQHSDTMECPQGTHFIRINHESGKVRFECYSGEH